MTFDDKQLDGWLRDVDVPADLQERLLALPSDNTAVGRPPNRLFPVVVGAIALAATIAGIAIFVRSAPRTNQPDIAATDPTSFEPQANLELAEFRAEMAVIEEVLRRHEIQSLERKLNALSSAAADSLDPTERASLIVSLSDQSALQLGASRESVNRDMARVIEKFPNTAGAKLAQEFISVKSNQ